MMKIILTFLSFLTFTSESVEQARNIFPDVSSLKQVNSLISKLQQDDIPEAKAYIGVLNMMKAKYVSMPWSKMKFFNRGKKQLNSVVNENPKQIEFRYLRFVLQKQVPGFLGYNDHIKSDLQLFEANFDSSKLSLGFKKKMLEVMLKVDKLTAQEENILKSLKEQL